MSTRLFDLRKARQSVSTEIESVLFKAGEEHRVLTDRDQKDLVSLRANAKDIDEEISGITSKNSILGIDPAMLLGGGVRPTDAETGAVILTETEGRYKAAQFRTEFAGWMNRTLAMVGGGLAPEIEATAPTGPLSIGSGGGADSIGVTVPTEVLPYLPAYFNLDSFALAGASQIQTDHTRPLVKPIISAGAADSTFAENAAPTSSQPFGLSSFTFNGTKYARLVLASYEALMNSELPLQGVILDELLASIATTFTTAITTAMYAAITTEVGSVYPLAVGGSGSIYTSMIGLRHAIPPRFDTPANKWMLSRATLATIKNCRASTSGVPMFDANSNQILGRDFVVNDNFDSICGAGFVVYGSWADGVWIRKSPLFTRVFLERFSGSGQVGYQTTQWLDQHFLAELVTAPQPPTFQPLYYTSLAGES